MVAWLCGVCVKVEASDERIDMERLKVRDKISFYSDIILFEDELNDSGCSVLSVKIVCCVSLCRLFSSNGKYTGWLRKTKLYTLVDISTK